MKITEIQRIRNLLESEPYETEDIGMSDSSVYLFSDKVLKVQKQSVETDYESKILSWLAGKLPVPQLLSYATEEGMAYTLMERIQGEMLCNHQYLKDSRTLITIAAAGLKNLWNVNISDCPSGQTRLDERLKIARYNVEHGLTDTDLDDPHALLSWLEENRPDEDLVLCHGDYCLPNIMAEGDQLCGFIDLSRCGIADRWRDIAICIQSMERNMSGYYSKSPVNYGKPDIDFFLQELGIPMDEEKLKYYQLLENLA